MTSFPTVMQAGRPWPMGAHWDGQGVNFAVFSAASHGMEVCLFDATGEYEIARCPLLERTHDIWHGYLPQAAPGLLYGLRASGDWQPEQGHRFNPHKLLLDPYAREIVGHFEWRDEHLAHQREQLHLMDARDNAALALKARVVSDAFDWGDDRPPATPLANSVLYELHVKGFSRLNEALPPAMRGTYAGLASATSIAHLKRLGVTAVSLLPVHYRLDEERLQQMGLSNYWGYNTLGFFAVDPRFASSGEAGVARDEFRHMVRALHAQGIEVILDVVYNHTAESNEYGPSLSFKGLDCAAYYRHPADSPFHFENFTGCGNTLDLRHPNVLRMVLDSLRFWVGEMHVDGFRFDLAPVLGRTTEGFNRNHAFFTALAQDPLLSRVKMIAEPWDVGPGGYQVGAFPRGWLEWNDHFRDALRGFWLSRTRGPGELAKRLCASADLFRHRWRTPAESVNYVVSHDGFTLRDLVSYNERHNAANGENNRDGHGHNLSFNCGAEGPSEDPQVIALRARLQRALMACTLLSQGTPMLAGGDELGHTQGGNNNAYCHDSAVSWVDWSAADGALIDFVAHVIRLRHELLPLGTGWYIGEACAGIGLPDLTWLQSDGQPLQGHAWDTPETRLLGCLIGRPGRGKAAQLLLVNGGDHESDFRLPAGHWHLRLDSAAQDGQRGWAGTGVVSVSGTSVALLVANPTVSLGSPKA